MEGRHLAVIASILIWGLTCLVAAYFASYKFSTGIIPKRMRQKTKDKTLLGVFIITTIVAPAFCAQMYNIGGDMEKGNGIAWGCYIEDFWLCCFLLWCLAFVVLTIIFIIAAVNPQRLGFQNVNKVVSACFFQASYSFLMIVIIGLLIPALSGPLSGKESSCW